MDTRSIMVMTITLEADAINESLSRTRWMLIGNALRDPACLEFVQEALKLVAELRKEVEDFVNTAVVLCFASGIEQPMIAWRETCGKIVSKIQHFCGKYRNTTCAATDIPRAFLEGLAGSNLDPA